LSEWTPSAIDVALAETYRERGAHEGGVERLAADQPGILHARVVGIERRDEARGAEQLQGIDGKSQRRRAQHARDARKEKTPHAGERSPHQNLK